MQNGSLRKVGNTYYARIYVEDQFGRRKRRELSLHTNNKKAAQKALNELLYEYEHGSGVMEKMLLSDHIVKWLAHIQPDLSPTSYRDYEMILMRHVSPVLGHIYLDKLKAIHLQDYYDLKRKTLSPSTVNKHHRIIKKMLQDALNLSLISVNPAEHVTPPKVPYANTGVGLTTKDAVALLAAVQNTDFELPCLLATLCGLRRGEICGLRWQDIDFERSTLSVRQNLVRVGGKLIFKTPKSVTSNRTISIPEMVRASLLERRRRVATQKLYYGINYIDNDLVICNVVGECINPDWLSRQMDKYLKTAGLAHIRFHDLRHTNATMMLEAGVPLKVASERLGHSSIQITADLYSHVTTSVDQEASKKIEQALNQPQMGGNMGALG